MKKSKKILILFLIILFLTLLIILGTLNKEKIIQIISGQRILNEDEEEIELITYKVYDNNDESNLKVLFTIQSRDGIEYIEDFTNNKILGYGKNKISIDYSCNIGDELKFKIKEKNKDEVEEKVSIVPELGTQEYPFLIKSANQLKDMANNYLEQKNILGTSNIYYKLTKNLDLNGIEWIPIGENAQTTAFGGYFNGDNHTISNLNIEGTDEYQGLFGYLAGQVYDLKLENIKVSGTNYIGALAGYSTGTITNCNIANIEIIGTGNNIGGFIGYSTGTLNNNEVSGTITASGENCGGIVGYSTGAVSNNTAIINLNGAGNVGGIVGNTTKAVNNNTVSGTIVATGNNIGGIIGYTTSNISGNNFNGNITGVTNVGGVCGYAYNNYTSLTYQKCYASGNITGNTKVGGIFGNVYIINPNVGNSENSCRTLITSCLFDGSCSALTNYAGGIIGYGDVRGTRGTFSGTAYGSKLQLEQSCCVGSVNSPNYVGGLIGATNMSATHGSWQNTPHNYLYIGNSYVANQVLGDTNKQAISNIIYAAGRW